jgi:hypothetical protein
LRERIKSIYIVQANRQHGPLKKEGVMKHLFLSFSAAVLCMALALTGTAGASQYRLKVLNLDDATGQFLGKPVKTY